MRTYHLTNRNESYTFVREADAFLITRHGGETWLMRTRLNAADTLDFWRKLHNQGFTVQTRTVSILTIAA